MASDGESLAISFMRARNMSVARKNEKSEVGRAFAGHASTEKSAQRS